MANGVRARKELIVGVRVTDRGSRAKLILLDQRSPFHPGCEPPACVGETTATFLPEVAVKSLLYGLMVTAAR
jgi:hypothetical protein